MKLYDLPECLKGKKPEKTGTKNRTKNREKPEKPGKNRGQTERFLCFRLETSSGVPSALLQECISFFGSEHG